MTGPYIVEFKTTDGEALAISIPARYLLITGAVVEPLDHVAE
jgi:hypothetical protein